MQSYQEFQQRSKEQEQETSQPSTEQPYSAYGPTQRASQPPEGTYQPPTMQEPSPAYQQPYQQPYQAYPPQQMFAQPYPGYVGAYPMAERKDWLMTLLLCMFVGWLGIHRFYTGHTFIGVIQLLTLGGCYVWTLIDLIMIVTDNYKDANGFPLVKK